MRSFGIGVWRLGERLGINVVGATEGPRDATDGKDALVAAADAALYRAKRSGKNRTVRAE